MSLIVCNVFTIAMAPEGGTFSYERITPTEASISLMEADGVDTVVHAVGHEQTAKLASDSLGIPGSVRFNRVSVRLQPGDRMLICQYVGPRLAEGVTTLPEGAELVWYWGRYSA